MKAADTKQQGSPSQHDESLEPDWGGVFYPLTPGAALDEWRPGFWDALVGYWDYSDPDRLRDSETQTRLHRSSDDEDFSSEHGYEPEFEGRSEFEHGEFERWL
ncbi:MAG: hypothetical protein RL685_2931 [Pseudomonadota bacterium]|jgi:hypothetical protein